MIVEESDDESNSNDSTLDFTVIVATPDVVMAKDTPSSTYCSCGNMEACIPGTCDCKSQCTATCLCRCEYNVFITLILVM